MTIKNVLVRLKTGRQDSPAEKYAISMAAALDAHITGIAFAYDSIGSVSQLGYMVAAVGEERQWPDTEKQQWLDNKEAARAALDRFSKAADRAALSFEPIMSPADPADIGSRFGRIARLYDLSVVDQPESNGPEQRIVEGALFDSGRPVIVVPYIQAQPFKLDRLMICWDDSRSAVRAIVDAMSLLARAERIEVVTVVNNEADRGSDLDGASIGQYLAHHGLHVQINSIIRGQITVADALLSHAADSGPSLIVMGGYGHSRLRELVLGGVTRSVLRSMTAPVFLSH